MSNKTPRTRPPSRTETQASFAERRVKCPACGNNRSVRGRVCSECRANRNALHPI
jgi:ribosomal protein L32